MRGRRCLGSRSFTHTHTPFPRAEIRRGNHGLRPEPRTISNPPGPSRREHRHARRRSCRHGSRRREGERAAAAVTRRRQQPRRAAATPSAGRAGDAGRRITFLLPNDHTHSRPPSGHRPHPPLGDAAAAAATGPGPTARMRPSAGRACARVCVCCSPKERQGVRGDGLGLRWGERRPGRLNTTPVVGKGRCATLAAAARPGFPEAAPRRADPARGPHARRPPVWGGPASGDTPGLARAGGCGWGCGWGRRTRGGDAPLRGVGGGVPAEGPRAPRPRPALLPS